METAGFVQTMFAVQRSAPVPGLSDARACDCPHALRHWNRKPKLPRSAKSLAKSSGVDATSVSSNHCKRCESDDNWLGQNLGGEC